MGYSKEDFDDVLRMIRPTPATEEELVAAEFFNIKDVINELKELFS